MPIKPNEAEDFATRAAFKQSAMWYFAGHLGRFRAMPRAEVLRVGEAASDLADKAPLHMTPGPLAIDNYKSGLSGASVLGALVAAVWHLTGECVETSYAMLHDWPDVPAFALLAGGAPPPPQAPKPSPPPSTLAKHLFDF